MKYYKIYKTYNIKKTLDLYSINNKIKKKFLYFRVKKKKKSFFNFFKKTEIVIFSIFDIENFVNDYLINFFKEIKIKVNILLKISNNNIKIFLNSNNNAILIGINGKILNSLNILLRFVINNYFKYRFKIMLDINNYNFNKFKRLKKNILEKIKIIKKNKKSINLPPMVLNERKFVHELISKNKNLFTKSKSFGKNRYIKIFFKKI